MRKMFVRMAMLVALAVPVMTLVGCSTPSETTEPQLTYKYLGPIRLNVASFSVENHYVPPLKAPNVEHLSPVTPYAAARQWGMDRIKAVGSSNRAVLVIEDAHIVEKKLPMKEGIEATFTTQQAKKYSGRIAVMLEILGPDGRQLAYVKANAERTRTAPEGTTIAQRENIWFDMTDNMMKDLNKQLETNIHKYLGAYLVGG